MSSISRLLQDFQDLLERAVVRFVRFFPIRHQQIQHPVDFLLGRCRITATDDLDSFPLALLTDMRIVFVGDFGIGAEDGEQSGLGDARLGAEARETVPERMEAVQ